MKCVTRAVLALMVAVTTMQRAEACSCNTLPNFAPTAGVPLNARLRVLDRLGGSFTLTLDGGVVPSRSELIPSGVLLTPEALLAPDTDYVLTDGERFSTSFRTGTRVDEVAPPAPVLARVTHIVSPLIGRSTCDTGGEAFSIALPIVDGAYEIFVGETPETIDTSRPALTHASNFGFVTLSDGSLCASNFPVSATSNLAIAIREVDLAGNASPLSQPLQLKGGDGCSSTGGPTVLLLASLLTGIRARSRSLLAPLRSRPARGR